MHGYGNSMALFETVTDISEGSDVLRRRAYGLIEVVEGRFSSVLLRPLPKFVSVPEIMLLGRFRHERPGRPLSALLQSAAETSKLFGA